MIGIEFMTGAAIFGAIRTLGVMIAAWMVYRIAKKAFIHYQSKDQDPPGILTESLVLVCFAIGMTFFGSAASPKLSIDVPESIELKNYQKNDDEVVIETPPPRTEKLDGFTPMTKE